MVDNKTQLNEMNEEPSKNDASTEKTASELLELAGDIALNVVTGGIYGTVRNCVEAFDDADEEQKRRRKQDSLSVDDDDSSVDDDDVSCVDDDIELQVAGAVAANVMTLGLVGDIYSALEKEEDDESGDGKARKNK